MFNYFLSWKQASGRIEDFSPLVATAADAIDLWHLISLSFLLAMCAEVGVVICDVHIQGVPKLGVVLYDICT